MDTRVATAGDLDLLAAWNHQLIEDEGHRNRMTVPELRERMRNWLQKEYVAMLACTGTDPLAYALYRESANEVYLRQLFVRRDRRREGIGRALVHTLRHEIWTGGKRLIVEVLCANTAALRFWRALGYRDYALTLEIVPESLESASTDDAIRIKMAKDRAYLFAEEQQRALDEGRISEQEWFEDHSRMCTKAYLAADNPRAQSGHGGDEAAYRYTRGMVLEAIDRSGTFLDVGCANGYLMEKLCQWTAGADIRLECYGLDISEGMLALARRRLPHWSERFFHGNALSWTPPRPFEFVYAAELGYVPRDRERELLDRLYRDYLAPRGRLIIGPATEERNHPEIEAKVRAWGYEPAGYCEKAHLRHPDLCKRMLWFDRR